MADASTDGATPLSPPARRLSQRLASRAEEQDPKAETPKRTPLAAPLDLGPSAAQGSPQQSRSSASARQPKTPQRQLQAMQRAPWSLLSSPHTRGSPFKPQSPYHTKSPFLPASPSPFVILEEGGSVFSFTLRKAEGFELGLGLTHEENANGNALTDDGKAGLYVKSICPNGAVEAWNRQCVGGPAAGKAVGVGDTIVKVNEAESPQDMIRECREKQLLRLTVRRGDGDGAPPALELEPALPLFPTPLELPPSLGLATLVASPYRAKASSKAASPCGLEKSLDDWAKMSAPPSPMPRPPPGLEDVPRTPKSPWPSSPPPGLSPSWGTGAAATTPAWLSSPKPPGIEVDPMKAFYEQHLHQLWRGEKVKGNN